MRIPVLETARLRLRGHRPEDFPDEVVLWSDPLVTQFIGGKASKPHETWLRMLRYVGLWEWLGYGYWVLEEKSSGEFIGEVGFADFKREMSPSFGSAPELGWVLRSAKHGQGLASEALRVVSEWGDKNINFDRTVCMIEPENRASLRVAEKMGYREYQRILYSGVPMILLERKKLE